MAKVALLIGVSNYSEELGRLFSPPKDVEALRLVLQDRQRGNFDKVEQLINPNRQEMEEKIESLFASCKKNDTILLFFSGHGVTDLEGKLFFATSNTRIEKEKLRTTTAVAASSVQNIMNGSPSLKQVVILDCCFSGAFGGLIPKSDENVKEQLEQLGKQTEGKGRVVLASSSKFQKSYEDEGLELSIYTHYLVEGIQTGAADLDKDGWISVDELHKYIQAKVQEYQPKMRPVMYAELQGAPIKLAQAPNSKPDTKQDEERKSDPKLEYRKAVENNIASNGNISDPARSMLDEAREKLGLLPKEAEKIEDEVLQDYRKYQNNKQIYENLLRELISESAQECADFIDDDSRIKKQIWQQHLGLKHEDVAPIYCKVGNDLWQQSKLKQADALYREAIRLDPNLAIAHKGLGDALHYQRMPKEAEAAYREAIRLNPNLVEAHKGLGDVLRHQSKPEEAEAAYREAIRISPNYAEAYRDWGAVLYDRGKPEAAMAKYRQAIERNPNDAEAHHDLGNVLEKQGKLEEATAELEIARVKFEEAIARNPKDAEAHAGLGNVLCKQCQLEEAARECKRAIELNPDNALAHAGLGNVLYSQNKLEEAIEELNEAFRLNSSLTALHNNLGIALHRQGKLDEAEAELRKAIEINPTDATFHKNLGNLLADKKKLEEAKAEYEEAIRRNPNEMNAYYCLGCVLQQLGKQEDAVAEYEKAIKGYRKAILLNPNNPEYHTILEQALQGQDKLEEAIAEYEEATSKYRKYIDLNVNLAFAYNGLGNALLYQNKLEEAITAYREAICINPYDAILHSNLGNALKQQGKRKEAIAALEKAHTFYNITGNDREANKIAQTLWQMGANKNLNQFADNVKNWFKDIFDG